MGEINKQDLQLKQFFEDTLGLTIKQEVILKMFDDQRDETSRQVGRDFDRFSRRGPR